MFEAYQPVTIAPAPPRLLRAPPADDLHRLSPALPAILRRHDPELIRRAYPWLSRLVDRYYRAEVEGAEHMSPRACLMVSTHNGSLFTPDLYCLLVAFWRRFGLETPGHALTHDAALKLPFLGRWLGALGALPARRAVAEVVLAADRPLLVCPGGDVDCLKPFARRHQIEFAGRTGFVALALRHELPIIPVVSVGAHEVLFVLHDGRRLAQLTGFSRLRIKSVPLALAFPFGLSIAGVGAIPLPSKIRIRVLPRIELAEPPSAADDPAALARCAAHVQAVMQRALDGLAAQRRRVLLG